MKKVQRRETWVTTGESSFKRAKNASKNSGKHALKRKQLIQTQTQVEMAGVQL